MNILESLNKGFERKYPIGETKQKKSAQSLTEAFSEELPNWVLKHIIGYDGKNLNRLGDKMSKKGVNWSTAHFEEVDPATLTQEDFKSENPLLVLDVAVPWRNGEGTSRTIYIPAMEEGDYITNPSNGRFSSIGRAAKADVIKWTNRAGWIHLDDKLPQLRSDRVKSRKGSLERGRGQYPYEVTTYNPTTRESESTGEIQWFVAKGQDKSGYALGNLEVLARKLSVLTVDNYQQILSGVEKALEGLKSEVLSLLDNPQLRATIFTNRSAIGKVERLADRVTTQVRELKEIRSYLESRAKGDPEDFQKSLNYYSADSYYSVAEIRKGIREIKADVKELNDLLAKSEVNESLKEGLIDETFVVDCEDGTDGLISTLKQIVKKYGHMELAEGFRFMILNDDKGRRLHIQ